MGKPLQLLMLEDSEDDEMLVLSALRAGGYEPRHLRVWSGEAMRQALHERPWDLIISDYCMPDFQAPDALAIAKESGLDVPFIIVSGTVGEDLAVAAMKSGASDYVMKDMLGRLAPSVERELREARRRRESELARTAAAQAQRDKEVAEATTLAKSQFLANMSHELRTPLNAIIGFSEMLEQGVAGGLTQKQAEYIRYVASSGRHLLQLVSDILDFSKVEAGKMTLEREPIAPVPAIHGAIDILRPLAQRKDLSITLSVPPQLPTVYADPLRLRQILYNLLSNAINYTPKGGSIVIAGSADGDHLKISVKDTGIGIRREELSSLFREFEQLATRSERGEVGTGLGLALTKRLVELHGGTITVESEFGAGTCFAVHLPFGASAEPALQQTQAS